MAGRYPIKGIDPDIRDVYEVLVSIKDTLNSLYFEVKALRKDVEFEDNDEEV